MIKAGLYLGEYNLNDEQNMMILPMGKMVADALGLPRHLNGAEGGERQFFDHPDYNQRVLDQLAPVMEEYAGIVKKAEEDHPKPPDKLTKDKVTDISDTIRSSIKAVHKRIQAAKHPMPDNLSLDTIFGR